MIIISATNLRSMSVLVEGLTLLGKALLVLTGMTF